MSKSATETAEVNRELEDLVTHRDVEKMDVNPKSARGKGLSFEEPLQENK